MGTKHVGIEALIVRIEYWGRLSLTLNSRPSKPLDLEGAERPKTLARLSTAVGTVAPTMIGPVPEQVLLGPVLVPIPKFHFGLPQKGTPHKATRNVQRADFKDLGLQASPRGAFGKIGVFLDPLIFLGRLDYSC